MNILYVGNFHDGTGYARACCETAVALDAAGANVICRPLTFNGGRNPCPVRILQLEDKPLPDRIAFGHRVGYDAGALTLTRRRIDAFLSALGAPRTVLSPAGAVVPPATVRMPQ